jgi:hypothetical protein
MFFFLDKLLVLCFACYMIYKKRLSLCQLKLYESIYELLNFPWLSRFLHFFGHTVYTSPHQMFTTFRYCFEKRNFRRDS